MKSRVPAWWLSAAMLLYAGCTSVSTVRHYAGPERDPKEVARLIVPQVVDLLTIDGEKARLPGFHFLPRDRVVELLPGPHEVVARYSVILNLENDDHEVYVAEPVVLTFDGAAGMTYALHYGPTGPLPAPGEPFEVPIWLEQDDGLPVPPLEEEFAAPVMPTAADTGISPLRMLRHWWMEASPADRAAFEAWLETQP